MCLCRLRVNYPIGEATVKVKYEGSIYTLPIIVIEDGQKRLNVLISEENGSAKYNSIGRKHL